MHINDPRLFCLFVLAVGFLTAFAAKANLQNATPPVVPEFRAARVYGGGGSIASQVTGDFNSDSIPDVIVSDTTNNNLRLFLGIGTGEFQVPPTLIPNVIAPQGMAAGDFNNDNKLDLVVAADDVSGTSDGVLVILGNGNGTFGTRAPYAVGIDPQTVLADDFNGDGKLDFVVFENFDSNLKVYFGDGLGSHTLSATISSIRGLIRTADFNGDGRPEIIARRSMASPLTMLANNGNGTFAAPTTITTGAMSSPQGVIVGNFNADSNLDLFVTSVSNSDNMIPLFGNGNNTFTAGAIASYTANLGNGSAGDFNHDQKTDLAMTNGSGRILVFNGNGNGTFASPSTYSGGGGATLVGDFNRDGWPDITSNVYQTVGTVGNFAVLLNKRDGRFITAPDYPLGYAVRDMATGYLNGDQQKDVVIVSSPSVGSGQVIYALGTTAGQFSAPVFRSVGIVPASLVIDDFNSDNIPDVVAGGYGDSGGVQNFAFLAGTGTGLAEATLSQMGTGISDMFAVDLNGDGKKDLAFATTNSFMTSISNGNGTFATPVTYAVNSTLRSIAAGDLNNDGHIDFAGIKNQTGEVVLLINNGSGAFAFGTQLTAAVFGMGIAAADMNGDSNVDLVVVTDTSGLYVFKGNGNGTFQSPSIVPAPTRFLDGLSITDFNQDGRPDVVCNSFIAGATVFVNDGAGGLVEPRTWATVKTPIAIWADDVNNDAKPDILAGGYEPGSVSVLLNGRNTFSVPSPFDFDGDRKTDIGIFRPSGGEWWINRSGDGQTSALQFGASTDTIVPADYTGDGKADVAIFRPSSGEWYVLRSEDFSYFAFPFGTNGDIPVPADYDADGKADFAVFRPSSATWYIGQSSGAPARIVQFGATGDQPVVSDYDGDGKADIGIFRQGASGGEWWIERSTAGLLAMQFGASTDKPVQGDYTGDGKTDLAIWRPSTGEWFIVRSEDFSYYALPFGTNGDIVAPGDYDGDGRFDVTVFRPSSATWFIARSTAGTQIIQFGSNGDRPLPNAFVP